MYRKFFSSLIILFLSFFPAFSIASTQSEALVIEGRQLLFKDGNPTYQGIIEANDKFKAAVEADALDQEAHLFYAVTRVASFALQTSDGGSFETIADIVQAMGIPIYLDELIENNAPFGDAPELAGDYNPPETLPDGDELRNVLYPGLVGIIGQALADLGTITNPINVTLTTTETGELTDIEVDYTDVLLARAFLNAFKSIALILSAYDLDTMDIREFIALGNSGMMELHPDMANQLLADYPNFLRLAADGAALLENSKTAFQAASARLAEAYDALNTEMSSENQDNDLFTYESEADEQEFENVLAGFSEMIDSLDENRPATIQDAKQEWSVTLDNTDTLTFTLEEDIFGNGSIARDEASFYGYIDAQDVYGSIPYWKITGSDITLILNYEGYKRIMLSGTLVDGVLTVSGTCSFQEDTGFGYDETGTGTFAAARNSKVYGNIEKLDLNNLFGNTEKSPLDIRNSLPEFDIYGEPKPGTFPELVFNGLFPDYDTNTKLSEEISFDSPYKLFTIPTATPDNDPSVWPAAFLVNTDPVDDIDNPVPGMDILNTYLAEDGTNLYMAMELSGDPLTVYPGTTDPVYYNFELRKNNYEGNRDSYQFSAYYNGSSWVVHVGEIDSYGNYNHIAGPYVTVDVSTSNFIKWSVPLSALNALETYGGTWIKNSTWCESIHEGDWVDSNTQLAPVYTIEGSLSAPDGYVTGDKIFIYLSESEYPSYDGIILGTYLESAGTFTLTGAPYSATDLYLYVLWDMDSNGILNTGDYGGMTTFKIQNDIDISGSLEPTLFSFLPIEAVAVKSVHFGDNQFNTFFDVMIGEGFSGDLPNDIDTITITYPDGTNHQVYPDGDGYFEYDAQWKLFYFMLPGKPQLGEYIFTVTDKNGHIGIKSDIQKDLITIPIVDVNTVKIDTSSKTPIVSWSPVSVPGTGIAYRLDLNDMDGNLLSQSGRDWNMTSCALPVLEAGKQYQYRIRACDDSDWIQVDNRSHTSWITFTMDSTLTHAALPAVDLDGWGAVRYGSSDSFWGFDTWIKIIDHDGVAYNGSSHTVTAVFLDASDNTLGEASLAFQYAQNATTGFYSTWINADTVNAWSEFPSAIRFEVTDPDSIVGSVTDVITGEPLTPPGDMALSCNVVGTTPTFTWATVPGANRHRVRIYDENFNDVWKGYPGNVTTYTVPSGILDPNTTYRYKLDARDAHSGFDTDHNLTIPDGGSDNYPSFTTGTRTDGPFIDLDSTGVSTWSDSYRDTVTSYWIKVYDAQGVPGNIQSVKVVHPDETTTDLYYEYNESANCAIYSGNSYETPSEGTYTYTFVAMDKDGNEYSLQEDLTVNPIGYPDESSLTVDVTGTGAEFNWGPVTDAAFYRLEIYNKNHERILKFVTTQNQYSLAPGFLEAGELYGFRVTTRREFWDQNTDNGSSSPWSGYRAINFKTKSVVTGTNQPVIDTNNFGVAVNYQEHPVTGAPSFWLQFSVNVTDADGVPGNIRSVTVQVPGTGIEDSIAINYDWSIDGNTARYWIDKVYDSYEAIPAGDYIFTVTDEDENTATVTDTLVKEQIPLVSYLTPVDGAVISSDSPLIDWIDPEGGPYFYKVRIYQHWSTRIHDSGILDTSSYIVPAGILKPGELYGYRIYAYDNDINTDDVDNFSTNQVFFAKMNHFTVSDEPRTWSLAEIFKLINVWIGNTSDIPSSGSEIYDINQDGQLNMQDIVPMLQEAGDLR